MLDKHNHENGHEQADRLRQEAQLRRGASPAASKKRRGVPTGDRAHELKDEADVVGEEGDGRRR